jgi:hypothetical protein
MITLIQDDLLDEPRASALLLSLSFHTDPEIARKAMTMLCAGSLPWQVLEKVAQAHRHHPDPRMRALAVKAFLNAPISLVLEVVAEAKQAEDPLLRLAAIHLLYHQQYRSFDALEAMSIQEIRQQLESLVHDPDGPVRETARKHLCDLGSSDPFLLEGLPTESWDTLFLRDVCLDQKRWRPEVGRRLLDLACQPLRLEPTVQELRGIRACEAFGIKRAWYPDEDQRRDRLHLLLPAATSASEATCLELGQQILGNGQGTLREAGAFLLGLAGEAGRSLLLELEAGEEPETARLGRLGLACSALPEGRARVERWLATGATTLLEEAGLALYWRGLWDPAAFAFLLTARDRESWRDMEPRSRASGGYAEELDLVAWWQQGPLLCNLEDILAVAADGLLPSASIPAPPEGIPPSLQVKTRALLALAQSGNPDTRIRALECFLATFASEPDYLEPVFRRFVDDADPRVRARAARGLLMAGSIPASFMESFLESDPTTQTALAWAVACHPALPGREAILRRMAREGSTEAALHALIPLLPGMSMDARADWSVAFREALGDEQLRGKAVQQLQQAPISGLGEELERAFRGSRIECWAGILRVLAQTDPERCTCLLESLASDPDPRIAELVVDTLMAHPLPQGICALRLLLERKPFPPFACAALGALGTDDSLRELLQLSRAADPWLRRKSVTGLGYHPDPTALERLLSLLEDPIEAVRRKALRRLGHRKEPQAEECLREALQSPDPAWRRSAAWGYLSLPPDQAAAIVAWAWHQEQDTSVAEEPRLVPTLLHSLGVSLVRIAHQSPIRLEP